MEIKNIFCFYIGALISNVYHTQTKDIIGFTINCWIFHNSLYIAKYCQMHQNYDLMTHTDLMILLSECPSYYIFTLFDNQSLF